MTDFAASNRYLYQLYDLRVASDFPLPELREASHGVNDVVIRHGKVPANGLSDSARLGPFLYANPREFWLAVPEVARFLIREGREIIVDPTPCVDPDSVRVFLLGSCLGALMFQRGFLVLHGNAVRIGDGCMICVGASGAGKSTLAASLLQRGYEVLADDVVPVDDDCLALPGYPRIKLWQDSAERLGIETRDLRRIHPELEKFSYPVNQSLVAQRLPVRWVYILSRDATTDFSLTSIQGLERFVPLRANTYRVRYLDGLALKSEHLKLCGRLAGRIRLAQVGRPKRGFDIDRLTDLILNDVMAHSDSM